MDKIIVLGYAVFLLLGAFFGWKAGSKVSLIMALASSLLTFLGYYFTMASPKTGYIFLSTLSAILSAVFIMRLIQTHKFMPSGGLLLVTVLFLLFCLTKIPKV